jgi:anti-anti-sigma regulatory factor
MYSRNRRFIDVSGVNLLARTAASLTAADRVLCVRAASPILVRMLQVTGLDQHLQIVESGEGHRYASRPRNPEAVDRTM